MAVAAPSVISVRRLQKNVDELGALNAQISALTRKADAIKSALKESGYDEILGQSYRAVVSTRTSARLDSAKVRKLLTETEIEQCTTESVSVSLSLYDL
jgi:type II secretory pathway component PulM